MRIGTILLVLLLIFGISGVVLYFTVFRAGAIQPPIPPLPPTPKVKTTLKFKSYRAVGKDPNTGIEDKISAEYEIYYANRVVASGKITDFSAVKTASVEHYLPEGKYKVVVYYPDKANSKEITESMIEVKAPETVVTIRFNVSEPSGYASLTVEYVYDQELYERSVYLPDDTEYKFIVNYNIVSAILKIGSNLKKIRIWNKEATVELWRIYTNVRLVQDLRIVGGKTIHTGDNQTTLEILTMNEYKPWKDCMIVVYRGGNPIIEKEPVELDTGHTGIREAISLTGPALTIYVKSKDGNTTYATLENIQVPAVKTLGIVVEKTYKYNW